MEIITLALFTLAVIISLIPTNEEKKNNYNNLRSLLKCESKHTWIIKKVDEVEGEYMVCSQCKLLAGETEDYEV